MNELPDSYRGLISGRLRQIFANIVFEVEFSLLCKQGTLIAVNCVDVDSTLKTVVGEMGMSCSRFAIP